MAVRSLLGPQRFPDAVFKLTSILQDLPAGDLFRAQLVKRLFDDSNKRDHVRERVLSCRT